MSHLQDPGWQEVPDSGWFSSCWTERNSLSGLLEPFRYHWVNGTSQRARMFGACKYSKLFWNFPLLPLLNVWNILLSHENTQIQDYKLVVDRVVRYDIQNENWLQILVSPCLTWRGRREPGFTQISAPVHCLKRPANKLYSNCLLCIVEIFYAAAPAAQTNRTSTSIDTLLESSGLNCGGDGGGENNCNSYHSDYS